MASTSATVKRRASELARPGPNWPGRANSMFVPRRDSSDVTWAVVPLPIVTNAMTAATPMTTPRTVRKERSMLRLIARSASLSVSKNMLCPPALGTLRFKLPVDKAQEPLRIGRNVWLMGHHDDRNALLSVETRHQIHDFH